MRHRSVQSRATTLTAAAVLAVAGLGSAAQAGFVLDLRLAGGGKTTTVTANTSSATTVDLEVWGQVTGGSTQYLQDAFFGISTSGDAAGSLGQVTFSGPFAGVATDVTPSVTTSYGGTVSSTGVGLGSNGTSTDWVFARSTSMVTASTSGVTSAPISGGTEFLLGTVQFSIPTTTTSGTATLHITPRTNNSSSLIVPALWKEENTVKDGSVAGDYISGTDVTITVQALITRHPGDFDADGDVDATDYVIWSSNVGGSSAGLPVNQRYTVGDDDSDGDIDSTDYVAWSSNVGFSGEPSGIVLGALAAVPEPTSIGLLGLGGLAILRRRRQA